MKNEYKVPVAALLRNPGSRQEANLEVKAPSGIGDSFYGVKEGSLVGLKAVLSSMRSGLEVKGEISATEEGKCSRCLKDIKRPVKVEFSAFMPFEKEMEEDSPMPYDLDEDGIYPLSGDFADFEGLIRDELTLQLSMVRLCKPDCKGLCPECGADLNEVENHSHEKQPDPRFAKLADLKERMTK
ncbi:MAG: DUF177 domain-containing protein [Aeriscardovia sp.]|nr:DUF177 domain-containing protein [Aeriscardovia sp.]